MDEGSVFRPHEGESIPKVLARVSDWLSEQTREPGHIVAITYSSVIRAAIVDVIQAELPSFWRIDIAPLSRTELRTNGRRWVLRSITPITVEDPGDKAQR